MPLLAKDNLLQLLPSLQFYAFFSKASNFAFKCKENVIFFVVLSFYLQNSFSRIAW